MNRFGSTFLILLGSSLLGGQGYAQEASVNPGAATASAKAAHRHARAPKKKGLSQRGETAAAPGTPANLNVPSTDRSQFRLNDTGSAGDDRGGTPMRPVINEDGTPGMGVGF